MGIEVGRHIIFLEEIHESHDVGLSDKKSRSAVVIGITANTIFGAGVHLQRRGTSAWRGMKKIPVMSVPAAKTSGNRMACPAPKNRSTDGKMDNI